MTVLFWFSACMLLYVFVGYPLLIWVWARSRGRDRTRSSNYFLPSVSILIVARNEQSTIRAKLENLLAVDYPRDKYDIVVVSDGSQDDTEAIVRSFDSRGIRLVAGLTHRGKPASLNESIPGLSGDIVILMDARQTVEPDCVRALVKNFSDPHVGAVSAELMLAPRANGNQQGATGGVADGVGFYWRYEKYLRRMESNIDSSVGATGALYAIRRRLFLPIASDTLLDDLLIPMNIVRQGYRVIFEPSAIARDTAVVSAVSEFRRKVRTIAGNFQLMTRETWLLSPRKNRIWIQTISHKLFRLTAPMFLLAILITNMLLLGERFYQFIFFTQLLFYSAALFGRLSESRGVGSHIISIPYAFCVLNWATVIGFKKFIFKQQISWK
jgi:poly-beta-1,6-N-acetyl-D-glucosamine synthase